MCTICKILQAIDNQLDAAEDRSISYADMAACAVTKDEKEVLTLAAEFARHRAEEIAEVKKRVKAVTKKSLKHAGDKRGEKKKKPQPDWLNARGQG